MSEEFIFGKLSTTNAVTTVVGQKIFPGSAPTGTLPPYITFNRITTPRVRSTKGLSGLASPRFQIDSWAATPTEARTLMKEIRIALDGFRGRVNGTVVKGVITDDESSDNDPETGLFRSRGDFIVWHNE